jgi:hypothetical protein
MAPTHIMPSENAFKKQAELASDALKAFVSVQHVKSTVIIKAAMVDLIDATVAFNTFVPFFVSHALFQEIPPAVHAVLEKFSIKNPTFEMQPGIAKIAGLAARARDALTKKGRHHYSLLLISLTCLPDAPVASRADKPTGTGFMRKPKGPASVSHSYCSPSTVH